ncbi:MAG: AraC family transcriptional regulator [Bacteroidota bacterium]
MKGIPVRKIKSSFEQSKFAQNFDIKNFQDLLSKGDMVQKTHRHDFFLLMAFEIGIGQHTVDFKEYKLGPYTIFLLRPGQVHSLNLKAKSKGFLIGFTADFFQTDQAENIQNLRRLSRNIYFTFEEKTYAKINDLIHSIFEEFNNKQSQYAKVIESYLSILLMKLERNQNQTEQEPKNTFLLDQLDKFSALLEKHIHQYKKVSDYAALMNISSFQLNKITKTTLGKTCSTVINEQVVLEAKRNLLATPSQVKEIAYHLGFEDVSYFIRFFKKQVGITPIAFRTKFK